MQPVSNMPRAVLRAVTTVMADIDDTITTEGRLPAASYAALERLHDAGLHVALITGRPAGWCDMIARFWPVSGVVGENGAFCFAYDAENRTMRRIYAASAKERRAAREKMAHIARRALKEVPGCAVAADQAYRETDLAIDFREDVPPLDLAAAERIKAICEQEGAVAKISSIHVNCWFGEHDKLSMARVLARDVLRFDLEREKDKVIYCGDSPNDAPMFAFFQNACGVANVADFPGRIETPPAWVASQRGGAGFVEIAEAILRAKGE